MTPNEFRGTTNEILTFVVPLDLLGLRNSTSIQYNPANGKVTSAKMLHRQTVQYKTSRYNGHCREGRVSC